MFLGAEGAQITADAVALAGEGRARVWRLYMSASALAFESGKLGVNQVLLQKPGGKRLVAADFLRGFPVVPGERFACPGP